MLRHSPIFWIATASSLAVGIYGFATSQGTIAIPYTFLNPLAFLLITSWKKFEPIKRKLEILGALILFLNIPGSIYLHRLGIQYDVLLHFVYGVITVQVFYLMLPTVIKGLRAPRLAAAVITIVGGYAFEAIQKLTDTLFGTHLFFDVAQSIQVDFTLDLLMNILGTMVGVVYLKLTSSPSVPVSPDRA